MKTYTRNGHYWEEVRNHVISHAQNWSRGTEGAALLKLALDDDWQFSLMQYAPAGLHVAPAECAAIIIRNFLILQ